MGGFTLTRRTLFLAFVAVGVLSGLLVGSLGSAQAAEDRTPKTPAKQSSLIVVVDELSRPQPLLLAAWQVQRTQGGTLEWTPLYPTPLDNGTGYAQPHTEVRLTGTTSEAIGALAPVAQASVSFDEIFVVDRIAVNVISTLTGAPLTLGSTAERPQAALQEQVQLVQSLCVAAWQTEQLDAWVALAPQHLQSSASVFELITRWDGWAQDGFGLHCSHPWANGN